MYINATAANVTMKTTELTNHVSQINFCCASAKGYPLQVYSDVSDLICGTFPSIYVDYMH